MPQLPRDDPFSAGRAGLPQRGVQKEKLAEGQTDADYLKGVPINPDIAAAGQGWALTVKSGEIVAAPLTGEGGAVGSHAIAQHGSMFEITDGGGLDAAYDGGRARIDATVYDISPGTITLTDDATNSVYINSSGVVAAGTSGFPSNSIPLAVVVTASGDITSISDRRALFYEDTAAGGGGTLDQAYDAGRTITADVGAVQIHNTDADSNAVLELLRNAATDRALDIWVTGDTVARLRALASGELQWGLGGASASDVQLKRSDIATLQIVASGSPAGTLEVDYLTGRSGSPKRVKFSAGAVAEALLRMDWAAEKLDGSGQITIGKPYAEIESNAGTSDDLVTIGVDGGAVFQGDFIFLAPKTGHTITIKHQASPSAAQIQCWGGADIVLDADYKWAIALRGQSNVWYAMAGGGGGTGGGETLDQTYDAGSKVITVDAGAIELGGAAAGTDVLQTRVGLEAHPRLVLDADGTLRWDDGTIGTPDVWLYRSGAETLKVDSTGATATFEVAGQLNLAGRIQLAEEAAPSAPGAGAGKVYLSSVDSKLHLIDDASVDSAILTAANHEAAGDPHAGYRLESADHSHQSTGLQAGQLDHGAALVAASLLDDDHTQYVLRSILTTNGDIFTRSGGVISRLGIGSTGQHLVVASGLPSWAAMPKRQLVFTLADDTSSFANLAFLNYWGDANMTIGTIIVASFTNTTSGSPGGKHVYQINYGGFSDTITLVAGTNSATKTPATTFTLSTGATKLDIDRVIQGDSSDTDHSGGVIQIILLES